MRHLPPIQLMALAFGMFMLVVTLALLSLLFIPGEFIPRVYMLAQWLLIPMILAIMIYDFIKKPMNLQTALIHYTAHHPWLEPHRTYIGLSGIADCPRILYDKYLRSAGNSEHGNTKLLTYYMGYAMEADIISRLQAIGDYQPSIEISLYDGLVKGHTDGSFNSDLLEIKSVALTEYLPRNGRLPDRVWWQVQAYMAYTQFTQTQVVYIARDYGELMVIPVRFSRAMQTKVENKIDRLVNAVRLHQRPPCECGKCRDASQ